MPLDRDPFGSIPEPGSSAPDEPEYRPGRTQRRDPFASVADPGQREEVPSLGRRAYEGAMSVLGAPKAAVDALARAGARFQGINVSDETTVGQMARAAAGLSPGADADQGYGARLGGAAIELGTDLALDPLLKGLGTASKIGSAGRAAAAFVGPRTIEQAAQAARAIQAGRRADIAGRVAAAAFVPGMVEGTLHGAGESARFVEKEGLSPAAAEELLKTGVHGAFAVGAGRHALGLPRPAARPPLREMTPLEQAAQRASAEPGFRPVEEPFAPAETGFDVWPGEVPESIRRQQEALGNENSLQAAVARARARQAAASEPPPPPPPPEPAFIPEEPPVAPPPESLFIPAEPLRSGAKAERPVGRPAATEEAPFYTPEQSLVDLIEQSLQGQPGAPRLRGTPKPGPAAEIPGDVARLSPRARQAAQDLGAAGVPVSAIDALIQARMERLARGRKPPEAPPEPMPAPPKPEPPPETPPAAAALELPREQPVGPAPGGPAEQAFVPEAQTTPVPGRAPAQEQAITERRAQEPELRRLVDDFIAGRGKIPREQVDQAIELLRQDASRDPLTGLGNRKAMEVDRPSAIGSFDVAGLKWVNDNLGHEAGGDVFLKTLGKVIAEEPGVRGFRTGGDEFLIHADSVEAAARAAQSIQERLARSNIRVQKPDGSVVDYRGARADYGVGEGREAADADLYRRRGESEARGERAPRGARPVGLLEVPAERQPDRLDRGPAPAEPRVAPREPAGAAPEPAEAVAPPSRLAEAAAKQRGAYRTEAEIPRDEMGNRILPGEENLAPAERAAIDAAAPRMVSELAEMEEIQRLEAAPLREQAIEEGGMGSRNWEGVEYDSRAEGGRVPRHLERAIERAKAGRFAAADYREGHPLEDLPYSPRQMREALKKDKGNKVELEVRAAVRAAGAGEEPGEPSYAVRPAPGQLGFEGIAPDVARPDEKRTAPKQTSMFGGEMLQGVERKVPEGRETEGPLFRQEAERQTREDAARQGTLPAAPSGPRKIRYLRNTEKAPYLGSRFLQDVEPAGRYVIEADATAKAPPGWEAGEVEFANPLVIPFHAKGEMAYDSGNWKAILSERYGGKRGKALTDALRKDGHDGIITVDANGATLEIVDLAERIPAREDAARQTTLAPEAAAPGAAEPLRYDPSKNRYNGESLTRGTILADAQGNRYQLDRANGFMLTLDRLNEKGEPRGGSVSISVDPSDTTRFMDVTLAERPAEPKFATRPARSEEPRDLTAMHNITAEELLKADRLGGLPVPSIAITRGKVHEGYGDITLVGQRDLVDPKANRENRIFPSDAYTGRFPETEWTTKRGAADKLLEMFPRREFSELGDEGFDKLRKSPDAAFDYARQSNSLRAQFLRQKGIEIGPVDREVPLRYEFARDPQLAEVVARPGIRDARPGDPEWRTLSDAVRSAVERHVYDKADPELTAEIRRANLERLFDEDGQLFYGPADTLLRDVQNATSQRREYDRQATTQRIERAIEPHRAEYEAWIREKIAPLFEGEFLRLGRRRVPVTLDNVVEAMRRNSKPGAEQNMVYGPGQARAAAAKPFASIEAVRAAKDRLVSAKDFKEWKDASDTLQGAMQESLWDHYYQYVVNHPSRVGEWIRPEGFGRVWDANDAMYRAMARFLKGKDFSAGRMRSALLAENFRDVPADSIQKALDVAKAIRDAPTEYFEAKPLRAVQLEEFAGAAIPSDAPAELKATLDRRGVPYEVYPRGDEAARQAAVEKLLKAGAERGKETRFATRQSPLGFYSQLSKVVDETKQPAGSGDNWLRYLSDPKRGVKADELKWTGLDDYLKERSGKRVSKEEIQQFLRENEVTVEETTLGYPAGTRGLTNAESRELQQFNEWRSRGYEKDFTPAERERFAELTAKMDSFNARDTKFGTYTLPGGENYREVLLKLPTKSEQVGAALKNYGTEGAPIWTVVNDKGESLGQYGPMKAEAERHVKMVNAGKYERPKAVFTGGHFDEPNVLAHVRLNDRVDADGKRVLFVEEIQSDWAQKGRREGFKSNQEPPTELPPGLGIYEYKNTTGRYFQVVYEGDRGGAAGGEPGSTPAEAIRNYYKDKNIDAVPAAPFVGSTEKWTELALKRILRMAAEEGYDRVAWTTGEQQASRYDLSKQVRRIRLEQPVFDEEGRFLRGHLYADIPGGAEVSRDVTGLSELSDYIGKEAADRIVKQPTRTEADGRIHILEGAGLKVGGEGMVGFYDKIVPTVANKLAKKWGAKVGESEILSADLDDLDRMGMSPADLAPGEGDPFRVHSIDITPAMRESVMAEGFPQFSEKAGGADLRARTKIAEANPIDIGGVTVANPYESLRPEIERLGPSLKPLVSHLRGLVREMAKRVGAEAEFKGVSTDPDMFAVTLGDNRSIRLSLPTIVDEASLRVDRLYPEATGAERQARMRRETARLTAFKLGHEIAHVRAEAQVKANPRLRAEVEAEGGHGPFFVQTLRDVMRALAPAVRTVRTSVYDRLQGADGKAVEDFYSIAENAWREAGHGRYRRGDARGDAGSVLQPGRPAERGGLPVTEGDAGGLPRAGEAGEARPAGALRGGGVEPVEPGVRPGVPERGAEVARRPLRPIPPGAVPGRGREADRFATAFHGSAEDFERFTTQKIGSGEGSAAFGWGMYFAGKKAVAEFYRDRLSGRRGAIPGASEGRSTWLVDGRERPSGISGHAALDTAQDIDGLLYYVKNGQDSMADYVKGQIERRIERFRKIDSGTVNTSDGDMRALADFYEQHIKDATPERITERPKGRLYKVDLAPKEEEYLQWDKPLSEQSEKVQEAIAKFGLSVQASRLTDKQLYARGKRYFSGSRAEKDAAEDYGMRERVRAAYKAFEAGPETFREWVKRQPASSYVMERMLGPGGMSEIEGLGESAYQHVVRQTGSPEAASRALFDAGVPGIKYLDRGSRAAGEGTYNYVIFDDSLVNVMEKYATRPMPQEPGAEGPAGPGPTMRERREQRATGIREAMEGEGGAVEGKPPERRFNLNRLDIPEDEKAAFSRVVEAEEARLERAQGRKTFEQILEDAKETLGIKTDAELQRAMKTGLLTDASTGVAARIRLQELRQEAERASHLARQAAGPARAEAEETAQSAAIRYANFMLAAKGMQAETARSLAAYRILAEPRSESEILLSRLLRQRGGLSAEDTATIIRTATERPDQLADTVQRVLEPKFKDKLFELWKAGLLSGVPTHGANFIGNLLKQGLTLAETAFTAHVTEPLLARSEGRAVERFPGEAAASWTAVRAKAPEAFRHLVANLRDIATLQPESLDVAEGRRLEYQVGAIGGKKGRAVRIPFRLLGAMDGFFKELAGEQELYKQALRRANRTPRLATETVSEAAQRFIEEYNALTPEQRSVRHPEITSAIEKAKLEETFQGKGDERRALDAMTNSLTQVKKKIPALNLIFPFTLTPGRIAGATLERTPWGFYYALKHARADYLAGKISGGEYADALTKPVLGTVMGATFAAAARAGLLTGSGPTDPEDRNALRDTGWQPYSFVFDMGDGTKEYVPFNRFEPVSSILGMAADLSEIKDQKKAGDLIEKIGGSILDNITNKTYLAGLEQASSALADPQRYAGQFLKSLAGSTVPAIVARTAQATDETLRETRGDKPGVAGIPQAVGRTIASRLPGVSMTLPPRYSGTGREAKRPGSGLMRFLSPSVPSRGEEEAVERVLVDIDAVPTAPGRDVTLPGTGGRKVRLTDDEYEQLVAARSKATRRLARAFRSPGFRRMDSEQQRAYVRREYEQATNEARARLIPRLRRREARP